MSYFRKRKISIPIYDVNLNIYLSDDYIQVKNNFELYDEKYVFANVWREDKNNYYIILDINTITLKHINHEVVHVSNFILDSRGVRADYVNDEPSAYLTSYIFNKVVNFIGKKDMFAIIDRSIK